LIPARNGHFFLKKEKTEKGKRENKYGGTQIRAENVKIVKMLYLDETLILLRELRADRSRIE